MSNVAIEPDIDEDRIQQRMKVQRSKFKIESSRVKVLNS